MKYDVIVVGLGAMGSAALFHLARKGAAVLGLDQFSPPHSLGSSHGRTRIIREAYFEHPVYVPLVQRAYELWAGLAEASGSELYQKTGGIMIGPPESAIVQGSLRSAREHHLPHELLDRAQIRHRFPALHPAPGMIGLLENRAGILFPEKCIAAHLKVAGQAGAEIHLNEEVTQWKTTANGVEIVTANSIYQAKKLILSSGSWLPKLLPSQALNLKIERQVLLWFAPKNQPGLFSSDRCPVHLWEYQHGKFFYGIPDLGDGVKVAFHHQGLETTLEHLDREVREDDMEDMREVLSEFLPDANGAFVSGTVCMYTNTSDEHFLIDFLPGEPNVLVASPCSGHGFKFSPAIGEVLADLAKQGHSQLDLSLFSFRRFGAG